jgi:hypothetical protein
MSDPGLDLLIGECPSFTVGADSCLKMQDVVHSADETG